MENYYKYHCGSCGIEWTKDDVDHVKRLLLQRHEALKHGVQVKIDGLESDLNSEETLAEDKPSIKAEIEKGKKILDDMEKEGPHKHESYLNGEACPSCESHSISGQEKE